MHALSPACIVLNIGALVFDIYEGSVLEPFSETAFLLAITASLSFVNEHFFGFHAILIHPAASVLIVVTTVVAIVSVLLARALSMVGIVSALKRHYPGRSLCSDQASNLGSLARQPIAGAGSSAAGTLAEADPPEYDLCCRRSVHRRAGSDNPTTVHAR